MTKMINLTPHKIVLRDPEGEDTTIAPSGLVARVSTTPGVQVGECGGVPLYSATAYGDIEGLPSPQAGTTYIVSGLVGGQVKDRDDVVVPGTGPRDGAIRNDQGHIVAVTRLNKAC